MLDQVISDDYSIVDSYDIRAYWSNPLPFSQQDFLSTLTDMNLMACEVSDGNPSLFLHWNREKMFQNDDQDWMNKMKNDDAVDEFQMKNIFLFIFFIFYYKESIEPVSSNCAFVPVHFHWHLTSVYCTDKSVQQS